MNKQNIFSLIIIIAVFLMVGFLVFYSPKKAMGELDEFARCLTESGAVFYYTETCPFCIQEKNSFGDSFYLLESVNCTINYQACVRENIEAVPVWIFNGDQRFIGLQGLERLSGISNCPLP